MRRHTPIMVLRAHPVMPSDTGLMCRHSAGRGRLARGKYLGLDKAPKAGEVGQSGARPVDLNQE